MTESVYFAADPLLKLSRSFTKPVRMGAISLGLGVLVLSLVTYLLRSFAPRTPFWPGVSYSSNSLDLVNY